MSGNERDITSLLNDGNVPVGASLGSAKSRLNVAFSLALDVLSPRDRERFTSALVVALGTVARNESDEPRERG